MCTRLADVGRITLRCAVRRRRRSGVNNIAAATAGDTDFVLILSLRAGAVGAFGVAEIDRRRVSSVAPAAGTKLSDRRRAAPRQFALPPAARHLWDRCSFSRPRLDAAESLSFFPLFVRLFLH